MTKLCKDCKWAEVKITKDTWRWEIFGIITFEKRWPDKVSPPICKHPKSHELYQSECDRVTGKSHHWDYSSTDEYLHCEYMRGARLLGREREECGKEGKLWEAKE